MRLPVAYMESSAGDRAQSFLARIQQNRPCIASGWPRLDAALDGGVYTGLYVLGTVSSLGKTTWGLQLIDNMVAEGSDALIFSLEMSADELTAKSVSRLTAEIALKTGQPMSNAKTTRGILAHSRYTGYSVAERQMIDDAIAEYQRRTQGHLWIFEGIGNVGVSQIRDAVQRHISFTGRKPVVFVDYLQILAPIDPRLSDKQSIDKNILELKRISRDFDISVIAVSSLNRENYSEPVSMRAFKESGAVEYSSDVLIGLQCEGMDYQEDDTNDAKRRKRVRELFKSNESRAASGVDIQLKVLKNRNGEKGKEQGFKFYPLFNLFREK